LFRISDEAYWFVRNHHHLITDGWSMARVTREAFELYRAWQANQSPVVARVRPYRDYIAWLQKQDRAAAEVYWRHALAGFSTPTVLGRPRSSSNEPRHAAHHVTLSETLTRQLNA